MLYCLNKPSRELEEVLEKLNGKHEDCRPENTPECDYIQSKVNDKEKFEACIDEAIKKIKEASKYVESMSSSYPYYTPYKSLILVNKDEFYKQCGKPLENAAVGFSESVTRYEYGEMHLSESSTKYGLYES